MQYLIETSHTHNTLLIESTFVFEQTKASYNKRGILLFSFWPHIKNKQQGGPQAKKPSEFESFNPVRSQLNLLGGCSGSSPMISPFFSFFLAMSEFKEMMCSVKVWGSISKSNHPASKGSVGIELIGRCDKSKFGQALPIKWAFWPVHLCYWRGI